MEVIEIMGVLIIILMAVGIIATSTEIMSNKLSNIVKDENIEKLTVETCDYLINNPGEPDNWQDYESGVAGLAILNEENQVIPHSVSYQKFLALGKNYESMVFKKLFDSKIKSSMEIIPQETSISSVKIGDNFESGNVYSVNRLVKCDFFKKYVIKDFSNDGKCNDDHNQDKYSCNYFKIFPSYLKNYQYYLLVDKSQVNDLKWSMDDTKQKSYSMTRADGEAIYLNYKLSHMFGDDSSEVVFIHLDKKDAKAVLVSVPRGFDPSKLTYDYFITNNCKFLLKAWY